MKKYDISEITLPEWNLPIFEELAKSHLDNEGISAGTKQYAEMLESIVYELAMESIFHAFFPSGEIGNNPRTPKIADSFFKEFDDILGPNGFFKTKLQNSSPKVVEARERQFKSVLVSLSQLYLEVQSKLKTKGRTLEDNSYRPSSFEYTSNEVKGKATPEEVNKMIEVETNRYIRLFMTTYFMHIIFDALKTNYNNVLKLMRDLELFDGVENPENDNKVLLRYLKNPKTRTIFVRRLREHLQDFKLKALTSED